MFHAECRPTGKAYDPVCQGHYVLRGGIPADPYLATINFLSCNAHVCPGSGLMNFLAEGPMQGQGLPITDRGYTAGFDSPQMKFLERIRKRKRISAYADVQEVIATLAHRELERLRRYQ